MQASFAGAEASDFEFEYSDGLRFRWATIDDIESCIYCGALAYGSDESEECLSDFALRHAEYQCRPSHLGGSPSNWAICVDKSANKSPVPAWKAPPDRDKAIESVYARSVRTKVAQAAERVVAVVCIEREYAHFDGQAQGAPFGRIPVVACLPAYRNRRGLLDGLFAMVHAKSKARGDAFCAVNGIPSYYRKHGYEYVMRVIHEMKTSLNAHLPLSDSPDYSLRPCVPEDAETIIRLHSAQLPCSSFFISQDANDERLAFLAGVRQKPFDDIENLDMLMANPVSILEYKGRGVAAVMYSSERASGPGSVSTVRLYVDPEHEDLGRLAKELVSRNVAALNAFWDAQVPTEGYDEGADVLMPKPKEVLWRPAPGNPLIRHFLDQKLAYAVPDEDMIFVSSRYQLFRLHSLAAALRSMQTALTTRLKAAKNILGSAVTFDLGIAFYQASIEGALIRIEKSQVVCIEAHSWKHIPFSRRDNVSREKPVQLVAPAAATTQIIFGYLSLDEAKKAYPDMQVANGCRVLLEVLFPRLQYGGHLYT